MKRVSWALAALSTVVLTGTPTEAQVYNLHLVTGNQPDYTDMKSFVESSTGTWKTPEEKAIAVWRWGRRSRRQLSCSREGVRYIADPILNYNSYGALNCGIISALNICSWVELRYQARYVQLGDHTVSQVSWDGGQSWHMFDSSMSFFCYNHAGQVASCEEIREAHGCALSGGKVEPGHYYFYHAAPQCVSHLGPTGWRSASDNPVEFNRLLSEGASSYTDGLSVDRGCQFARYGHRYVLNIRPYESYTRYWTPADDSHLDARKKDPDYFRPLPNGLDPDGQKGLSNVRSNGRWVFQPNLSDPGCERLFYDSSTTRLSASSPKLAPSEPGRMSFATFQISAANIITSMQIEAEGICQIPSDQLRILVSRNTGIRWKEVWRANRSGPQSIHLKLRDEVAGTPFCWIKIEMLAHDAKTATGLDSLKVITNTLVNRLTLPSLVLGSNQVLLRADEQAETVELWPFLHANLDKDSVFAEDSVFSDQLPDGGYKPTLGSAVNNKECSATWRSQVPTDIMDVSYTTISTSRGGRQWVSLQHSWDGKQFDEFYRHADGDYPLDRRTTHQFKGRDVPGSARQAFFRGVFFTPSGAGTYTMAGLQDLLIRIHHKPRAPAFTPFEVTYNWTEHRVDGDFTRTHSELIKELPHLYQINVAGRRNSSMNWVRINLPGYAPENVRPQYGYSDGVDVGPGFGYNKVHYRWGKNLALGKSYTATRPSSVASGNPDTDGRELTNGIVIAPTEYMATKIVQPATAFWDGDRPVTFTLDLGRSQNIAGVRVATHQPNARYCHPATVQILVSDDGQTWVPVGTIRHDDLFKPPGDYEAWEWDNHAKFAALPAGGRLVYAFPLAFKTSASARYVRFVFTPLKGRGLGISELQVYDRVNVAPWPVEIFLPGKRIGDSKPSAG